MSFYKKKLTEISRDSKLLHKISDYFREINNERDISKILELLADLGRELIDAERCTVWVSDEKHEKIYSQVAHGVDFLTLEYGEGLVGFVIENDEELIINNPYEDKRFSSIVDEETGYETKQLVTIPIKNTNGEVLGAFQGVNSNKGEFSGKDLENLRMVAAFSAKTIENLKLIDELNK